MRAGLLSDPEVIQRLGKDFVCTMAIIDDVRKRAAGGDELAKQLEKLWQYPVEMLFFSPEGKLLSKLNSYEDFPGQHPEVAAPTQKQGLDDEHSHVRIFMRHLGEHFGKE